MTVLHAEAAAVPVVAVLAADELHEVEVGIESHAGGGAEAAVGGATVSRDDTELVVLARPGDGAGGSDDLAGHTQKGLSAAGEEITELVLQEQVAGVELFLHGVIIQLPVHL